MSSDRIEVEVHGEIYSGAVEHSGGVLTVSAMDGDGVMIANSTVHKGPAGAKAKMLLRELVAGGRISPERRD